MRTDRQTWRKLTIAFRNFPSATKNDHPHSSSVGPADSSPRVKQPEREAKDPPPWSLQGEYRNNLSFYHQRNEWRKLHNKERNDLCFSQNIVWVIKSRRMRWVGNVARMGRGDVYTGFWWGNLRERDHLEYPGVDWRIILRWIFSKCGCGGMDWIDLAQDRGR